MLKVIEPQYHVSFSPQVELFLDLIEKSQDLPLTIDELYTATFILAENEDFGLYGGAILWRRPVEDLYSQIRDIVSTFLPHKNKVLCGTLSLGLDSGNPFYTGPIPSAFQTFHTELLQCCVNLGVRKKIHFLCLTLSPMEYYASKKKGHWPYLFEVNPQHSLDGLFHGILPLKANGRSFFEPPQRAFASSSPWRTKIK